MNVVLAIMLIMAAVVATLVVLSRDNPGQTILLAFYGLVLSILLVLLQAPAVALSQIVVGAVAVPMIVLLVLAKARGAE